MREELKNIEVGLFLHNIASYKENLEKIIKDEEILNNQNEDENKALNELNELKQKLKTEIDNITTEIEDIQNMGASNVQEKERLNSRN